ncbi:membrane-associated protein, putative [Bodo saltans]|uniref:Membrane-associated protein, putative n=1 Tax=Bodo saltans TaxID=75058 RepID=A0A0S4J0D8_BODSA|nr:membrane-associated protein, putative [Bodo saltans]|eukprot:CUG75976.1 membrane-associated protein, putative [Bodo saltans]
MLSSSDRLYVSDDGGSEWRKRVLTIAVPGVVGLAILFGVVVAVKHATGFFFFWLLLYCWATSVTKSPKRMHETTDFELTCRNQPAEGQLT